MCHLMRQFVFYFAHQFFLLIAFALFSNGKKDEKQCTILFVHCIWNHLMRFVALPFTDGGNKEMKCNDFSNWKLNFKKWISNKMQVSVKNVECCERRFLFSILWYLFWRALPTERKRQRKREKESLSCDIDTKWRGQNDIICVHMYCDFKWPFKSRECDWWNHTVWFILKYQLKMSCILSFRIVRC